MTAGTWPVRRKARAAPLPVRERVDAWRFACWAIEIAPQSNNELTDWSLWVYPIALDTRPAIESTRRRSNRRSGGIEIVLVTATSLTGDAMNRSTAGPDNSAWVAQQ